jgi:hypothetical protein
VKPAPKNDCGHQCFIIGGPFIAEDPACPVHGHRARSEQDLRSKPDTERLRDLLSKATPGPWRSRTQEDKVQVVAGDDPPSAGVAKCGLNLGDDWPATVNGALIAEARNALPALLDAYDVLEDAYILVNEGGDEEFTDEVKARMLKVLRPEMYRDDT